MQARKLRSGFWGSFAILLLVGCFSATPPASADDDGEGLVSSGDTTDSLKPTIMEPEAPGKVAKPAEVKAEAPVPVAPTPVTPEETTSSAPEPAAAHDDQHDEAVLANPTQNIDAYEALRKEKLYQANIPKWSITFNVEPVSFSSAELRVNATTDQLGSVNNPKLIGAMLGAEKVLIGSPGILSFGGEFGFYGATQKDPFSGLMPGILSLSPYLFYEVHFMRRQWVVPTAKAEFEIVRYNYSFDNAIINGIRGIPRIEVGGMLYLNFLEPSAGAQMQTNYSVKRTYLTAALTYAPDSSQKDLNLTDHTFRIGFRFEL